MYDIIESECTQTTVKTPIHIPHVPKPHRARSKVLTSLSGACHPFGARRTSHSTPFRAIKIIITRARYTNSQARKVSTRPPSRKKATSQINQASTCPSRQLVRVTPHQLPVLGRALVPVLVRPCRPQALRVPVPPQVLGTRPFLTPRERIRQAWRELVDRSRTMTLDRGSHVLSSSEGSM